ncbi:MAG: tetratricopeptide repeat protein, partial [Phycisphaerae bacterium]|nr:tetratricopeptide repeat protein [Phycisphaerae bacterium]
MAKRRKRLNKRVVIVLCVLLGLVLSVVAVAIIYKMPKDPQPFIDRGDEAFKAGDFGTAAEEYSWAIKYRSQDAEMFLRAAQAVFELADDTELPRVKRREHYSAGRNRVNQSLQIDPELLEAQELKTDLVWRGDVVAASFRNDLPDWEGYIAEATKLIALDQENAEVYFRRGLAHRGLMHRKEGNHEELARADFARAVELDPENVMYLVQGQIALLEQADKLEEAQSAYELALEKNPTGVQLRVRLAMLLYRTGDKAGALDQIQMAVKSAQDLEPFDQLTAQLALGDYYLSERRVDEAMQAYETAESIEPGDFHAYVRRTFLLRTQGRYEEATGVMRKAFAVAEGMLADEGDTQLTPDRRNELDRALIDLRYRIADSLLDEITSGIILDEQARADRLQEARDHLQIIESKQDVRPIEPRYYRVLGQIALVEGHLDEAQTHLLKAYEDVKAGGGFDEQTARLLMGLYERRDRLTDAEEMIDEYLARPNLPNRMNIMLLKARLLMKYREYDDAKRIVQGVLAIRENYGPAILLQRQLEFETSPLRVDLLPEEVELTPRQINVMIQMASRMWVSDEREEALRQMEELHRRAPKNLYVIRRLGQMYLMEERKEDAEALLVAATEAYPDNDDLKFDLELMREESPAHRDQMRQEHAEQMPPLERVLFLANMSAFSAGADRDKETITYLRAAAEINPQAAGCLERLFALCLRQRGTEHAEWALEQAHWAVELAAAENLDGFDGRLYEARLAAGQDKVPEAVEILK